MKQLIETIVKPLVEHPEDVQIDVFDEQDHITYKLTVHKSDVGKVIGKQGRVAKAIRTVVYAHAQATKKKKVYLKISE
ncbi:KH domain-containing protein [Fervidibacillus albus]|uniref:RNA-binding protein KhpA n=1 Tax=Fervidibacillus albus TaxID=2980026 RepID=A0A9E8LVX9_9BACI|nr:KH domain-containing protein [Fervidibacillus albus]WAA10690.1 KH domain-containing protein [Fervidibacillus albus]